MTRMLHCYNCGNNDTDSAEGLDSLLPHCSNECGSTMKVVGRMLNDRFHINMKLELVKTSNGQVVPDDEPLIVLRGRDRLAYPILQIYRVLCEIDGCNDYFIREVDRGNDSFRRFIEEHPERMKQPGVTRGR